MTIRLINILGSSEGAAFIKVTRQILATERKVCYYMQGMEIRTFVKIRTFGHFNQAQNYGKT